MGIPNYVPDASKIWGSSYSNNVGNPAEDPNSAEAWKKRQAKTEQDMLDKLQADAVARDKGFLGRVTPALQDTTPEFQQLGQARANQQASLDNLRNSAMGLGPSYANAQTQQALGARINSMAPVGNALQQRAAMFGGNLGLGQTAAQGAQARGTEMGAALGAYGTGAQAIRGGDLAGQQAAIDFAAKQRALQLQAAKSNQGITQGFEGLDIEKAIAQTKADQGWYQNQLARREGTNEDNMKKTQAMISTMAAVASMAAMSDRRVKKAVR